ncbi:S66 peptidase family protein [Salinimicrobium sediminilitoris]|uniref:S66 peptidase family protein n=1 Tax=Salinimicrobium sediminilitoris TaxID=2876715 RepID=UPI001E5D224F|nr:LD-carboxypeptidase [Salinimicrobium sediminilitoris]MCC8360793.1 LD-carboxypeptidase [Salinimicrobium sediminilitoris]
MERRKFLQNMGFGSLALPLYSCVAPALMNFDTGIGEEILPKRLQPGDTIGIVSPSGAIFESEPYEIAVESMQALGLKVKLGEHVKKRYGHLAGTDEERAQELNLMFKDPSINAIICLRGGSGAARILNLLDYEAIQKNPKIFIGYSDITALHLAIYKKTGLVTFHGPLATSTWNIFAVEHFKDLLFEADAVQYSNPVDKGGLLTQTNNRIRTITAGSATGELLGGNLSVLTGLMGTPYFPTNWEGKILYLEDVGERIYAVDRMMSQLQLGGVLDQISGFIFGKCSDCEPGGAGGYGSLTMEEVLDHFIKPLNIPAFSGTMIGHISDNFTIPNGIRAEMNAEQGTFKMLNPAVR